MKYINNNNNNYNNNTTFKYYTYIHTYMEQNKDWFGEPNKSESVTSDMILRYVQNAALCYNTEIADELNLDPRTVSKWLRRLLVKGDIAQVDMTIPPTAEQATRINEFRAAGMKPNHFKNAKWYFAPQGGKDE